MTPKDVATSFPPQAEQARSRPQNDVATSSLTGQVTTSIPCRDLLDDQAYVATSSSCCDLNSQQARSRRQFHVATFWRLTYVATSISCRDLIPAHSGISKSRRQIPCRDLPHCRPCHDIKFMSRCRFFPTKADQVATSLPCHDLTPNQTRSRPHNDVTTSRGPNPQQFFFFFFKASSSFSSCYSLDAVA